MKSYVADTSPQAIFKKSKDGKKPKTIGFQEALEIIKKEKPDLFSIDEENLLDKMKGPSK